ncbi:MULTISPECIES: IS200/IS605 family transposase [unclassified Roseofilum]|uniref:IS200/IS605 family transposase n=1 Tax=unclassified Roseofilum TaxID=2620099 RepID=UPI000E887CAE|nr:MULTISPECIES: IS200/IS605 family transposase [unclassified Roseofilum]MBP0009492.1 IS200/IS605 family transposase [Roseofilum sp. Belize Diploria]MBP0031905.1 IS200/IS605 family transposase [Roseofilum sp. Belize BBD 4]HBQ97020.1 IS200/IS605 family transposase [Cyanobacteria bacterium UBA11691]
MSNHYDKGFRSIYALTAHLVLVTKYRKKVINPAIHARLADIFQETCSKWETSIVEFNGEVDRVHLLIRYHPQIQLSKFIANLKTVSSRLIRKEFEDYLKQFYRKPVFWTGSYFVASCGGVTVEQLKQYVQQQEVPGQ